MRSFHIKTIRPGLVQFLVEAHTTTANQPTTAKPFTFLGEKLSAELPGSDHFARDLPEELRDQSDVVCPPLHTSQREQARFSITACTHMNTHVHWAARYWHTLLPRGTAWTCLFLVTFLTKLKHSERIRLCPFLSLFGVCVHQSHQFSGQRYLFC